MDAHVEALRRYRERLLRWPNVVGVGVGKKLRADRPTDRDAVIVLVTSKLPEADLASHEMLPRSLTPGVLTDVVEVGEVRALVPSREEISFRHARQRPAPGGVSIGHREVTAGTLGMVVRDAASGDPLILSNNHVLVGGGASYRAANARERDAILQPAPYDGGGLPTDVIGNLRRHIPIQLEEQRATCRVARRAERGMNLLFRLLVPGYRVQLHKEREGRNLVDAAVAIPVSRDLVSNEIRGIGEPNGTRAPSVGLYVRKSGRSTGVTGGEITAVGSSIRVKMGEGNEAVFSDQILTEPLAQPGDSGSILVDADNRVVGLLSAGSDRVSVSARIDNVLELLDLEI